ncbi:hypothetical protein Tco_0703647 [Tanacetum coccineum]|uniref:Uncharacterized protein n=1 Tax=Tanacetum coccineum TaxID=301880 RepID=A0ABQ4Y0B3_9ASTR
MQAVPWGTDKRVTQFKAYSRWEFVIVGDRLLEKVDSLLTRLNVLELKHGFTIHFMIFQLESCDSARPISIQKWKELYIDE